MREKKVYISIYILIPSILSGISIINFIIAYHISKYYTNLEPVFEYQLLWWGIAISILAFLCGFFILRLILKPITRFVKQAENLPVFPKMAAGEKMASKAVDDLEHMSLVFDQITNILSKVEAKELFPEIIGQSKTLRLLFSQILKVAPTDSTILISGESGTGKELVATSIYEHSLRKGKSFIKLNCVAIPEGLLESELFGHEKGAFTGAIAQKKGKFELADGGTIFLDEIGDMPLTTQAKLLRVLQEKEFERVGGTQHPIRVDVRFIAATNKNLPDMVKAGAFREDLFYRLNVFFLQLPPLRERRDDIPLLADYFLGKAPKHAEISNATLNLLLRYDWPGNVRELQNTMERAAVMTENGIIEPRQLPSNLFRNETGGGEEVIPNFKENTPLDDWLKKNERQIIIEALKRAGGIQVRAAQLLGINQRSLWHRIRKHEIDASSFKKSSNDVEFER